MRSKLAMTAAAIGAVLVLAMAAPADAQRGHRGGGGWHGGGGHGWHGGGGRGWRGGGGWGWGAGAGFAAGALIGGALAAPYYYGPGYGGYAYEPAPAYGGGVGYCMRRFKSYDPASGTYLGYDGMRHPCP